MSILTARSMSAYFEKYPNVLEKEADIKRLHTLKVGEMIVEEISSLKKISSDITLPLKDAIERVEKSFLGGERIRPINELEEIVSNNLEMLAELEKKIQYYKKRIYDASVTDTPDYDAIIALMYCFNSLSKYVGKYDEYTYIRPVFNEIQSFQKTRDALLFAYSIFKSGSNYTLKYLKVKQMIRGEISSKLLSTFGALSDRSLKPGLEEVNSQGFIELNGLQYIDFLVSKTIMARGREAISLLTQAGYDSRNFKKATDFIKSRGLDSNSVLKLRADLSIFKNENVLNEVIEAMQKYKPTPIENLDGLSEVGEVYVVGMVFNKPKKDKLRERNDYRLKSKVVDYNLVIFNNADEVDVQIRNVRSYKFTINGEEKQIEDFLENYHPVVFKVSVNYQLSRNNYNLEVVAKGQYPIIPLYPFI